MNVLTLTNGQILDLLPSEALIAAVAAAARAAETNEAIQPVRGHLHWRDNTLLTMPAIAEDTLSIKLVSVIPGNAARDLPVTVGLMMLQDATTGMPLALLNAGAMTARRTGAVGALGTSLITPPDTASVGIVGCGTQGAWQAIFACAARPITEIFCASRSAAGVRTFLDTVGRYVPAVKITPCATVDELLARTDLIITATTASEPVLPDDPERLRGKHFVSVGSFRPTMQELPDGVYRLAGRLVIDSAAARHEVGDVINPLARKILADEDVFTLGQLVNGSRTVDVTQTTVFKAVGMALYDLYVAKALYREARRQGIGRDIEL